MDAAPGDSWVRAALIKLLGAAMLIALAWPLPAMIAFRNEAEGVILGRYTITYALLLGGYLLFALAWAGLGVAGLVWLRADRLEMLRQFIARHILPVVGLTLAVLFGFCAVRVLHLSGQIAFPGAVNDHLKWVPGAFAFGLIALVALIADARHRDLLDRWLDDRLRPVAGWLDGHPRLRNIPAAPLVAGLVIALGIGQIVLRPATWDYPLTFDPAMHVYIGQHLLDGGVPYETLIVPYPPLRFAISLLWSLGGRLAGVHPAMAGRAWNVAAAAAILALTYGVAARAGGHRLAGVLGVALLLAFEGVQELLIDGPNLRLTIALLMLVGLWLAQRGRWLWAGLLLSASALTYAPVAAMLGAVGLAALLQSGPGRWKHLLHLGLGASGLLAVVVAGLLALGLFERSFALSIGSPLGYVAERIAGEDNEEAEQTPGFLQRRLRFYRKVIRWSLRGDWEVAVALLAGSMWLAVGRPGAWRRSETGVWLLSTVTLLGLTLIDFQGSAEDNLLILACAAPLGAAGLAGLIQQGGRRHATQAAGWLAAALLLAVGLADTGDHQRFLYGLEHVTFGEQQRMARQLEAALEPGQTVMIFGNVWPLALADLDNASPFRLVHYRNQVFEALDMTPQDMWAGVAAQQPVLIMVAPSRHLQFAEAPWLETDYLFAGYLPVVYDGFEGAVFVRKGAARIEALVRTWPLLDQRTVR